VIVYDNFSKGKRELLPKNSKNLIVFEGDIIDGKKMKKIMKKYNPGLIYHLVAIHHIPTCEKNPEKTIRVNIEGTQTLLNTIRELNKIRLIFASTGAVYSDIKGCLSEDVPLVPRDVYGITKVACEELLKHHHAKYGLNIFIARLFNTVGKRETNPHVVPAIIRQIKQNKKKICLGNIHSKRDYIHVEDVAQALFRLGNVETSIKFDIFNIGTGKEYSVCEIVDLCSKILNKKLTPVRVPGRIRRTDRLSQLANIKKINDLTSWKSKKTLYDALRDVMEEYHII